jgi:hypothetical protein
MVPATVNETTIPSLTSISGGRRNVGGGGGALVAVDGGILITMRRRSVESTPGVALGLLSDLVPPVDTLFDLGVCVPLTDRGVCIPLLPGSTELNRGTDTTLSSLRWRMLDTSNIVFHFECMVATRTPLMMGAPNTCIDTRCG